MPITTYETGTYNFPLLWTELRRQCIDAETGCDVMSIPHNPNLAGGLMFPDPRSPQEAEDRLFSCSVRKKREEAERAERGVWLQLERDRGTPWPPNTLSAVTRAWRYQRPVQHLLQESERFAQLARPPLNQCLVEVVLSRQQLDFYHGRKNLQRILAVFLRSLEVLEP